MQLKIIITSTLLITIGLTTGSCSLDRNFYNSRETRIKETNFRTECANRKSAYLHTPQRQANFIPDGEGFVEIFSCTNEHTKQLTVAFDNQSLYFDTSVPGGSSIGSSGTTILAGTKTVKFLTQGRVWEKGSLEVKPKSHIRFVVNANEQTVQVDNSTVWKPNLAIAPDEAYDLSEANRLEQQEKYQRKIAKREAAGIVVYSVCNDLSPTNVENNNQYQNGFDSKPDGLVRLNFVSCTDDSLTFSVENSKGEKILTENPLSRNIEPSYDAAPGIYKIQLSTQGKVVQKGTVEVAQTPSLWMVFNLKEQSVKVNTPHVWKPGKVSGG